jgi:hypothetical protein
VHSAAPAAPAPAPVAPVGPGATPDDVHAPGLYRDRCRGARVLVLAAGSGLDTLSPADLGQATVVAVPESIAWLNSRMGLAQFVCATAQPRTLEAAAAMSTVRTVLVHADGLDGATIAPRARAHVPLQDLSLAGWPALGWSDELDRGYFPGPGDAGLALQWALWLGPAEIVLAGSSILEAKSWWPEFLRGAAAILAARGVRFVLIDTASGRQDPGHRNMAHG